MRHRLVQISQKSGGVAEKATDTVEANIYAEDRPKERIGDSFIHLRSAHRAPGR